MDKQNLINTNNPLYIFGMIVGALNETLGMFSENMQRYQNNESMAYNEKDFHDVLDKWGVNKNSILHFLDSDVKFAQQHSKICKYDNCENKNTEWCGFCEHCKYPRFPEVDLVDNYRIKK